MSLVLYNANFISIADLGSLVTSHNGVTGSSVDVLLYLKNDSPISYYTDIVVTTVDSDSEDDTLGVYGSGRGFKLSSGDRQPTESEWENVLAGDFINLNDIGSSSAADTTTYFPFWVRVIIPGNTEIQTFDDVSISVNASEHLVGA